MQYEKKFFGAGSGNFDDADFAVEANQWTNMENCRVGSTDFPTGAVGYVESVGSTVLITSALPSSQNYCIGGVYDQARNRIVYMIWNSGGFHQVRVFDIGAQVIYVMLYSSQVEPSGLNFDKNIFIHSVRVVNGALYWVNSTQEQPRYVNIDAAIRMNYPSYSTDQEPYSSPIQLGEITLIKPPPAYPPNFQKDEDVAIEVSFIANESYSFAFQYVYYTNEETVVGPYSGGTRLNKVTDDYNLVVVTMNPAEVIPSSVRLVNLVVRIGNTAAVVKTWDRNVPSEAAEIANQNNDTQFLSYYFSGSRSGISIAQDKILKPFDSVPIYSHTLESAKNRIFLGNNVEGYDTPGETSLSYMLTEVDIEGATALTKNLISLRSVGPEAIGPRDAYSGWYVFLTEISPVGYYAIISTEQIVVNTVGASPPPLPPPPTSETSASIIFRGATQADVIASVEAAFGINLHLPLSIFDTTTNIVSITGLSVTTFDIFKTQSQYKIGVVFYDFALRKCGVVTRPFTAGSGDPTLVTIPARPFALTEGVNSIVWSLSNTNALTEIPEWAYYYSIVRTLNLRTRFFLQAIQQDGEARYAFKDSDGIYDFTNTAFVSNAVGIALNTTSLVQAGLGYVYAEGDICYLIKEDNTAYALSVIGQSGNYIIVNVPEGGIGDFLTNKVLFEIYTPYKPTDQEPYYEVGNMYAIASPGTASRAYSALSDNLVADAYALTRNYDSITYFAETMSPNDRFYKRWDNDSGKVNLITKIGQQAKESSISYSDQFIAGTSVNGLSTFEALNEKPLPVECGAIRKLQLTSKVSEQGSVMLAICANETASLYLGEVQVVGSSSNAFLAQTQDVIGTINILKGSYGTANPESVCEVRGNVHWFSLNSGRFVQYSLNGLFPTSNYKATRFWKLFAEKYASMSAAEIEALGSRPFVVSGYDPRNFELLVSIPKLSDTPPRGFMVDYPSMIYPFDILDFQAKAIVYKLEVEPNFWQGSYNIPAEFFVTAQDELYAFKDGSLYRCNDEDSFGNFFGVQYKPRIMFVSNQTPNRPKAYNNVAIEANMVPTFVYMYNDYPYVQASDLVDFDFEVREGTFYAPIYRNKIVPTATGMNTGGLLIAEKMRGIALRILIEFTSTSTPLQLRFVTVGFTISHGHTT